MILLIIFKVAFPQWFWQGPLPPPSTLSSVCFTNGYTGYSVGENGVILKTMDYGYTWTSSYSGSNNWLYSVVFPSFSTGYIAGQNGTILKTTDAGANWNLLQSGTPYHLQTLFFLDNDTGWAGGWFGIILKTIDGGATWTRQPTPTDKVIYSIFFTDPQTGYAAGQEGTILKTTNGGTTWVDQSNPSIYDLNSIYFTDQNHGCIAGGNLRVGLILSTTDGGSNWNSAYTNNVAPFYCIKFANSTTGYAIGGGIFVETQDGGQSWFTKWNGGVFHYLYSFTFTNPTTAYAVGQKGDFLVTMNTGSSWVSTNSQFTGGWKVVYFKDANTGFLGGAYPMLKTTNGGNSWQELYNNADGDDLVFTNVTTGYLCANNFVYKTVDGGNSFYKVSTGLSDWFYLNKIFFVHQDTGFAVAGLGSDAYSGAVIRTTDAGEHWSVILTNPNVSFYSVYFTDASTGYVCGNNGTLLKTTNCGNTWNPIASGYSSIYSSVWFTDASIGYVIANEWPVLIGKTTDGGSTWHTFNTGLYGMLNSIYFVNKNTGFAVGNGGVTIKTINAGESWFVLPSITNSRLYSVFFINPDTGFTVGENMNILKTINGASTPLTLSVSPASANVASLSGNCHFEVTSNSNWLVTSTDAPWCTMLSQGTYDLPINVNYSQNNSVSSRTGHIRVTLFGDTTISQTFTITQAGTGIGIEKKEENHIHIFPNPSDGLFKIHTGWINAEPMEISIQDLQGNIITRKEIRLKEDYEMDLSSQSNGCYFMIIKTDSGVEVQKLIIFR